MSPAYPSDLSRQNCCTAALPTVSPCRRTGRRGWAALAFCAAFFVPALTAPAQAAFGALAVGSNATQSVTVVAQQTGTVNSVKVVTAGAANLDFTDGGGTCGSANLTAGQQCTESVTFTPAYPGSRLGAVVLLDGANHVLGTTYLQGSGTGGLGVVLPGTMQTYAGNGDWKSEGDGELATSTELFLPSAVALDGLGNLYIADSSHNRVRVVCSGTAMTLPGITCAQKDYIYTIAGDGTAGYTGDGQLSTNAGVTVNDPSGVTVDGAGNLYIADTGNNVIREISASTGIITTVAGNGAQGFSGDGGPATGAALNQPTGVAVDLYGNVLFTDTGNARVRAVCAAANTTLFGVSCAAAGNVVTIAGSGSTNLGDGGQATAASLSSPYTLAFDANWNLYIADSGNNRIRAICAAAGHPLFGQSCSATGVITTVAGGNTKGYGGDGGPAVGAELDSPSGVVLDPAGNLYIADTQNFRIRKVNAAAMGTTPAGTIITIAGNGSSNYGGDNGPANAAGLYGPYGLALDPNGNLFIAEFLDNRVREVQGNLSVVVETAPVRQGSTSPTTHITVENDGTSALALTSIQAATNTQTDPTSTTCANGTSLNADQQCVVGAVFAPASSPTLTSNQTESGTIDVTDATASGVVGSNSPLQIEISGTAEPVNSTTTVLTSTPTLSTFGQTVTLQATITTGANTGALSGTVTFYDGANTLAGKVAINASGVATFTTAALSVGVHSLTAAYSGDTLHFASTSTAISQTVNEATATALTTSGSPATLGAPVTFTATVSTPNGGGVMPDGTVIFMDGGNALGTVALTGTTASYTTSTLPDGINAITAVYSGDPANNILGSTSAALNQDVLAGSTVVLQSSANPSTYGTAVTFTAAVTASGSVAPSGTVVFLDGATQIGSTTLAGTTGVATLTTSALAAGSHAITASYKGDTNDGAGVSTPISQVVNAAPTSTILVAAPSPGIAGKAVTLTATVTGSGGAALTGSVQFTDGSTVLGSATVGAHGIAVLAATLTPGAHALAASYTGDANDGTSASAPLAFTVNLATTQVALSSSGSPAVVLSPVTFTATVSGNGGTPTGTVTFTIDGATAGTGTLNASGVATFNDSSLLVGTHTVSASYAGDTDDSPSASSTISEVETPIATTTSLGASSAGSTSTQSVLVATTLATTGPTPTGTITFSNGTTVIGAATLDSNGVATLVPDLAPGKYSIVASYGGDSLHAPSTSSAVVISGSPAAFAISLNPPNLTLATSQNGTVNVTLTSDDGFADTIGMGCLSLPAGVNCHFSSNNVALAAGQSQTVQLTIDTDAPLSGGTTASNARPDSRSPVLAGLFLPFSVLFGCILWRFRRRNAAALLAALVLFLGGAFALTGCGGFSQQTAAPGTYTIQIGGVGTSSNISHYQSLTLTITK